MGFRRSLTVPLVFLTLLLFAGVAGWLGSLSVSADPEWDDTVSLCDQAAASEGFSDDCGDFCFFALCDECCECLYDSECPPPPPEDEDEGEPAPVLDPGAGAWVDLFGWGSRGSSFLAGLGARLGFGVTSALASPAGHSDYRNYSGCSDPSDGYRDYRSGTGCGEYSLDCSPCLHWHWFFNDHNDDRNSYDPRTGLPFFVGGTSDVTDSADISSTGLGLQPGVRLPGSAHALRFGGETVDASFNCRESANDSVETGWSDPDAVFPVDPVLGIWGDVQDGVPYNTLITDGTASFGYMTSIEDSPPVESVRPGEVLFHTFDGRTGEREAVSVPGSVPVQVDGSPRLLQGDVPVDSNGALRPVSGGAPMLTSVEGIEIPGSLDARVRIFAANHGGRDLYFRFWVYDGFEPFVANLPFVRLVSYGSPPTEWGVHPVQVHPTSLGPVSSFLGLPNAPVGQFSFQLAVRDPDGEFLRSNVEHVRVGYREHPWVAASPSGGPTSVYGDDYPTPVYWRPEMLETPTPLPTATPAPSMTPVPRPSGIRIQLLDRIPGAPGGVNLRLAGGVSGSFQYRAIPFNGTWGDEAVQPWVTAEVPPVPLPILGLQPGVVYVFSVRVVDEATNLASAPSPVEMILTWADTFTPQVSWLDPNPEHWRFNDHFFELVVTPTPEGSP